MYNMMDADGLGFGFMQSGGRAGGDEMIEGNRKCRESGRAAHLLGGHCLLLEGYLIVFFMLAVFVMRQSAFLHWTCRVRG